MKFVIFGLLLATALTNGLLSEGEEWAQFKAKYNKLYGSESEELYRRAVFDVNLAKVRLNNALYDAGLVSYKLGINQFSDLTEAEFKALISGGTRPVTEGDSTTTTTDVPTTV